MPILVSTRKGNTMAKTYTITFTEKEIKTILLAMQTEKDCYDYDHDYTAEDRQDIKAMDRIENKIYKVW